MDVTSTPGERVKPRNQAGNQAESKGRDFKRQNILGCTNQADVERVVSASRLYPGVRYGKQSNVEAREKNIRSMHYIYILLVIWSKNRGITVRSKSQMRLGLLVPTFQLDI